MFRRSRNSGREFIGWNQLLCRSVLTRISCAKFKIHSTHAYSPRAQTNAFACTIWKTSLCFISKNSGREFVGWNQLLCRSVLTPISYTKFKIHSTHAESPRAKTNFFACKFCKTSLCFADQETQEENLLGGTNSFVGQFLHASLVQSSRSIPHMHTVQGPKQMPSLVQYGRAVFVSYQKTSGREFVGWNQLLRGSVLTPFSCTKFKIHSTHADRVQGPKQMSSLVQFERPAFVGENLLSSSF